MVEETVYSTIDVWIALCAINIFTDYRYACIHFLA